MSLYKRYGMDQAKLAGGVWMDLPRAANEDKSVPGFLIRRCHKRNTEWLASFEEVTEPRRPFMDAGLLRQSEVEALTQEAHVGTCLVGWRNVVGQDGQSLGDFSKEKALQLVRDLPELWDEIWAFSLNGDNFRSGKSLEADAKN